MSRYEIEQLTQAPSDIASIDLLGSFGHHLVTSGDYKTATLVSEQLERKMPLIDENAYLLIQIALSRGDYLSARQQIEAYQERDIYYLPAIEAAIRLARIFADYELLRSQLELLSQRIAVHEQLIDYSEHPRVHVLLRDEGPGLAVNESEKGIEFVWARHVFNVALDDTAPMEANIRDSFQQSGFLARGDQAIRKKFVTAFVKAVTAHE